MPKIEQLSVSDVCGTVIATLFWIAGAACALPAAIMLAGAFFDGGGFSLANLAAAYSNPARTVQLLFNSAVVTFGTVCISLALGTPIGFLSFRTDLPFRRVVIFGALIAACIPVYVTVTSWMALFGMHFWLNNAWGAAWIQGMAYTPLVILVTGAGFAAADREQEEAAALDADARGVFRHVSIPQGSWAIAVSAMIVAALAVSDITVTDILTVRTFAEEVFTQFQLGAGPDRAAAVSLPIVAIVLILATLAWRQLRAHGESSATGLAHAPAVMRLGVARYAFAIVVLAAVAAFFLLPLASLVKAVGSFKNLAVSCRASGSELLGTLRVVPAAALICVALSGAGAWAAAKLKRGRWIVMAIVLLLIATPAPVIGIGIIRLLNRPGWPGMIYDSQAVLVYAYVIRTLPFGILALLPAMKRIPGELDDTLALSGASWLQKTVFVILPLCWRAIAVAWLLVFVLSLGELGASFLVVPPGRATLTLRFFTLIHYGVYPDAAGICLILLAVVGIAGGGIAALLRPTMKRCWL